MAGQGDEALLRADVPSIHVLFRTIRHGRACPGHPRSFPPRARTWIPGTRPGKTAMELHSAYGVLGIETARSPKVVMAGRGDEALLRADVPSIHVLFRTIRHGRACPGHPRSFPPRARTWIPGTRPGKLVTHLHSAHGTAVVKRRHARA